MVSRPNRASSNGRRRRNFGAEKKKKTAKSMPFLKYICRWIQHWTEHKNLPSEVLFRGGQIDRFDPYVTRNGCRILRWNWKQKANQSTTPFAHFISFHFQTSVTRTLGNLLFYAFAALGYDSDSIVGFLVTERDTHRRRSMMSEILYGSRRLQTASANGANVAAVQNSRWNHDAEVQHIGGLAVGNSPLSKQASKQAAAAGEWTEIVVD